MRIAIYDPDGSGRWNIVAGAAELRIYLDEKLCRRVIAADDVEGVVWVAAQDGDGNYVIDHDKKEVVLERKTGKVEIRRTHRC